MNGVIPLKDGSTRKNSIDTLKPHGDPNAEGQPRNIIISEPSVAEKMSWAPPDRLGSSGACTTQAPQNPIGVAGSSTKQVPPLSSLNPLSVSGVSRRESEASRDGFGGT